MNQSVKSKTNQVPKAKNMIFPKLPSSENKLNLLFPGGANSQSETGRFRFSKHITRRCVDADAEEMAVTKSEVAATESAKTVAAATGEGVTSRSSVKEIGELGIKQR